MTFPLEVSEREPVEAVSVAIELRHGYLGDLIITLEPPTRIGGAPVTLHRRAGGARTQLKKVYDRSTSPKLSRFAGQDCHGTWTLRIRDVAAEDSGTLVAWSLRLVFPHPERGGPPAPVRRAGKRP